MIQPSAQATSPIFRTESAAALDVTEHRADSVITLPSFAGIAASAEKARLVVASNHVADPRASSRSGGPAGALAGALAERGGVLFGWNGRRQGETGGELDIEHIGGVERITAPLSADHIATYHEGYANGVLWPLFHYRPDRVDYRPEFFEGYCKVNDIFARQLAPFLKTGDLIWVQDHHLILLASHLRRRGCRQKMGFFLHIPFPPPDLLMAVPNHAELVAMLLEHDVIGLQTRADLRNLKQYLKEQSAAVEVAANRFRTGRRTVAVGSFPVGIDAHAFASMAGDAQEDVRIDLMRRHILGRKQIIGVDRLDYSRGLPERSKAFDLLLRRHPELEKKVTLVQFASPAREEVDAYADIRTELASLSGSINGGLADFNWTPVRYVHRPVPRARLAPLLRGSQVGFVTPLRDGMSLVAKEYVAAQNPGDPGVLVLSQFAGAAEEMHEALIVNPYDIDDMARQLHRALTMPLEERQRRHRALFEGVVRNDADSWLKAFLAELEAALQEEPLPRPKMLHTAGWPGQFDDMGKIRPASA